MAIPSNWSELPPELAVNIYTFCPRNQFPANRQHKAAIVEAAVMSYAPQLRDFPHNTILGRVVAQIIVREHLEEPTEENNPRLVMKVDQYMQEFVRSTQGGRQIGLSDNPPKFASETSYSALNEFIERSEQMRMGYLFQKMSDRFDIPNDLDFAAQCAFLRGNALTPEQSSWAIDIAGDILSYSAVAALLAGEQNIHAMHLAYALENCLKKGNEEIPRMILESGRRLDDRLLGGALEMCVATGKDTSVRLILGSRSEINASSLGCAFDAYVRASNDPSNDPMVRLILESGKKIDGLGYQLRDYVKTGNDALARLILKSGSEMHDGDVALETCIAIDNNEIAELILKSRGRIWDRILGAMFRNCVASGKDTIARLILKSGRKIDDHGLGEALEACVEVGNEAVARLILECGMEVNGWCLGRALGKCVRLGNDSIARMIIECNQKIDPVILVPVFLAAYNQGREDLVDLILDNDRELDLAHWFKEYATYKPLKSGLDDDPVLDPAYWAPGWWWGVKIDTD